MSYMNQILRVNLNTKVCNNEPLDLNIAQKFLGGRGYAVKVLYDELKQGIDPLSPDNKIMIMTGPMTGTTSPTSSRWCMTFKSPLTRKTLNTSHCGGKLGIELKRAGYDGIIFEEASETPIYLLISENSVSLKDASDLWGKLNNSDWVMLSRELQKAQKNRPK